MNKLTLWLRWIAANAFGEMLGLGLTFTAAGLLISGLGKLHGVWLVTASFFIAVALLFAGLVVGAVHGAFLAWVTQPASA